MEILRGYGLGTNMTNLLVHYWKNNSIVHKERRFLEQLLGMGWGVTQVNPASPMISNIVIYFVV